MDRAKAAEEEFFQREATERRLAEVSAAERAAKHASRVAGERKAALEAKRCPKCRTLLGAGTLGGAEVDRCLSCGGVWIEAEAIDALWRRGPGVLDRVMRFFSGRRSPPPAED